MLSTWTQRGEVDSTRLAGRGADSPPTTPRETRKQGKSMTSCEPRSGLIEDVRLLVYSELAGAGRVDGADSLATVSNRLSGHLRFRRSGSSMTFSTPLPRWPDVRPRHVT